jgi:hypothetical protein
MIPTSSYVSAVIGTLLWTWIAALGIQYVASGKRIAVINSDLLSFSGTWFSSFMPVADNHSFDNTAHKYNASRVLGKNIRLDVKKYEEYSPIFLSTEFALQYGLSFATIVSVVTHVVLHHGNDVWGRFKAIRKGKQEDDYHTKLYEKYPEVPQWWFAAVFVINIGLGLFVTQYYETSLPWWAYLFSLLISAVFLVSFDAICMSSTQFEYPGICKTLI